MLIAVGAALFMLPNASTRPLSLVDALFTSASAVCVTGLSTIDVGKDLTFMGQVVLMLLLNTTLALFWLRALFGLSRGGTVIALLVQLGFAAVGWGVLELVTALLASVGITG